MREPLMNGSRHRGPAGASLRAVGTSGVARKAAGKIQQKDCRVGILAQPAHGYALYGYSRPAEPGLSFGIGKKYIVEGNIRSCRCLLYEHTQARQTEKGYRGTARDIKIKKINRVIAEHAAYDCSIPLL